MRNADEPRYRRVNITLGEEQYQRLNERGLNISGLIRDLIGDYLAENRITLQVSGETKRIYDLVIANTGSTDADLEVHLKRAMAELLEQRIDEMQALHKKLIKR